MCLRTSDSLLNEVLQPRTGHTARFLPLCRSSTSEVRLNEFRVEPLVAFGAETCEIACSGGASESMLAKRLSWKSKSLKPHASLLLCYQRRFGKKEIHLARTTCPDHPHMGLRIWA